MMRPVVSRFLEEEEEEEEDAVVVAGVDSTSLFGVESDSPAVGARFAFRAASNFIHKETPCCCFFFFLPPPPFFFPPSMFLFMA